ncbi:MAG: acyl-[acyl-carrier-protein] thioesterase [Butyrivibrio sp.]|nr:acyl-[acyl-carrier-protein] thioesterase [Butyrivibrio sp.]
MYKFNSRIRFSEIDKNGKLDIEGLINYFQDCSTFQTEDSKTPMKYLYARDLAWVVSSWQIEIFRMPSIGEKVVVGTIPYDMKGFIGYRNFFLETEDGERLSVANSIWSLIDIKKGLPVRVTPEIKESYPLGEKLDMNYGSRKIALPKDARTFEAEPVEINYFYLDTNNHVNNSKYIEIALGAVKEIKTEFHSIRAIYQQQAREGDIIKPLVFVTETSDNITCTIALNDTEGKPYCIVELI